MTTNLISNAEASLSDILKDLNEANLIVSEEEYNNFIPKKSRKINSLKDLEDYLTVSKKGRQLMPESIAVLKALFTAYETNQRGIKLPYTTDTEKAVSNAAISRAKQFVSLHCEDLWIPQRVKHAVDGTVFLVFWLEKAAEPHAHRKSSKK